MRWNGDDISHRICLARALSSLRIYRQRLDIPEEEEEVVCLVASYFRSKFGIRQKDLFKKRGYIFIKGYVYSTYILHWTSLRRESSYLLFAISFSLCKFSFSLSSSSHFERMFYIHPWLQIKEERLKLKFSFPDCWYLVGSWSLSLFCFFASDIPRFLTWFLCSVVYTYTGPTMSFKSECLNLFVPHFISPFLSSFLFV